MKPPKLQMHTQNKVDENITKIAQLFPNCVTERKNEKGEVEIAIDFDMLRQELSNVIVEGNEERYQFTWPDKRKSILLANAPIAKTLRPCREESVDFDKTENLYIEGDNLDVLKLLQETYLGKVKMIYIDPPYNTGNDFVYSDKFEVGSEEWKMMSGNFDDEGNRLVQNNESNGRFHTDWLNMIYPRLKLAKDLLSDDGVILINMDENEITNLQKMCIEIFGEVNDLGTIVWDKRNPKGDAKGISYQHEYIVAYAKNKMSFLEKCKIQRPKKNAELILKKASQLFNKINPSYDLDKVNNDFSIWLNSQTDFSGGEKAYNKIDQNGDIYQSVSMGWPNKKKAPEDYFIPLIHPVTQKQCPVPERGWRNPSATMKELLAKNLIIFGSDEKTQPRRKYLLVENMKENIPSLLYYGGSDTDLLNQLGIPFDTPKVIDVCKEHIQSFTENNDIILDFFSGSATTAHAVMQLNAEDGGNRKFIMVQLPELTDEKSEAYKAGYKNICEIGKERIRRAGAKISEKLGARSEERGVRSEKRGVSSEERNSDELEVRSLELNFEEANNSSLQTPHSKLITDNSSLITPHSTLDTGFRVLKLDTSNMKDVYYEPKDYDKDLFTDLKENIKPDRTPEDLLFQVMLDLGVLLSGKIEETVIDGKKVFNVEDNYLIACFDDNVTETTVTAIAKQKPYYFVMRDSSMATDSVATNFEQIFATYSPETIRRVL